MSKLFSSALRFAYSTTIIAPSIRMPTDKINENKTTTLIVTPIEDSSIIDNKKDPGIDKLTRIAGFNPIQ